jgi:peroxiredoxin
MKRTILNGLLGLALAAGLQAKVSTGDSAPDFSLPSHEGKTVKLSDYRGKTVVLEWINEGCPFVVKHYDKSGNLPKLQKKYTDKGVVWLGIVSSAEGEQGYWGTGEEAKAWADKHKAGLSAILFDPEGTVGQAYGAKTTPHMYIITKDGKLAYQGAIDNKASTKVKDIKEATNWVAQGLDEVLAGKPVSVSDTKPYGCGVKYKKK